MQLDWQILLWVGLGIVPGLVLHVLTRGVAFHWRVLSWLLVGVLYGLALHAFVPAPAWSGLELAPHPDGVRVEALRGPGAKSQLEKGDLLRSVIVDRGEDGTRDGRRERIVPLSGPEDLAAVLGEAELGEVLWLRRSGAEERPPVALSLDMEPDSTRARVVGVFGFAADIFLLLLQMLIVPLVFSSIVTGVASVGSIGDLRRLGFKTIGYYLTTSLLAILLGQTLVNLVRPGEGARLGLSPLTDAGVAPDESFLDVLKRMVPPNVFTSLGDNAAMLQVIFFALLLGFFLTRAVDPHGRRIRELFESFFEVMMKMAQGVLALLPYGVFALMVKVVATTGFSVFEPLLLYMATVAVALLLHACLTLPALLRAVGGISPVAWFRAMSSVLMTAFSTSSSSMTLPVTLRAVEEKGRVSNKVTSFTLPLGATINMDGTALYECIGVIFLAQYYASLPGATFELTLAGQALVVMMALMASIGAAGIPSAGLVMMLTILSALGLPLEGAALLLAVDRPLDMMRTVVNVWSDTCGAAIIARTEGERGPVELDRPAPAT